MENEIKATLPERLRDIAKRYKSTSNDNVTIGHSLVLEAADEIERLRDIETRVNESASRFGHIPDCNALITYIMKGLWKKA